MPKDIKIKEKQHHTIKQLDRRIAYTSRIKQNMVEQYQKNKQEKDKNKADDNSSATNYAINIISRTGNRGAKEGTYAIVGVSKYAYRKAKLKRAEKNAEKDEDDNENENTNNTNNDIKTRDRENEIKSNENNNYTNDNSNTKITNSKSKLKKEDSLVDRKEEGTQNIPKRKLIKEKQNFKNIKQHNSRDIEIKNNTAIKIKTRDNTKTSNDVIKIDDKTIQHFQALNKNSKMENIKRNIEKTRETSKKVGQTIKRTGKAIARSLKGMTTLIIAGGSFVLMIVIIIVLVAGILKSTLGFFFANDNAHITGNMTIGDSIDKLEDELDEEVQEIKSKVDYDKVVVNKGDIWWKDIITMYAVIATNRDGLDVTTMNEENYEKLKEIFNEVVDVDYETSTYYVIYVHTVNGQQVRERQARTRLEINIKCMTFDEMVGHFAFSVSERNQAIELLQPQYDTMWEKIFEDF